MEEVSEGGELATGNARVRGWCGAKDLENRKERAKGGKTDTEIVLSQK